MRFTINSTAFIADQDEGNWFWTSDYADSENVFPTAHLAQKDAIRFMRSVIDEEREDAAQAEEDAQYGTYEQQHNRYYYSTRL